MRIQKISLTANGPILPGSIFKTQLKCGKQNCRCATNPKNRHIVYQWSGLIEGKNTTRTLTKEMFLECKKRIENYKKMMTILKKIITKSLEKAPWIEMKTQ